MKLSIKLFFGFFLILLLFLIEHIFNYQFSEKVNSNIAWLSRSEERVRISSKLHREIIDMENGFRGYLLTGNPNFLTSYINGKSETPRLFNELQKKLNKDERQYIRIDSIQILHNDWVYNYAEKVVRAKTNSLINNDSLKMYQYLLYDKLNKEDGKRIIDKIRAKFTFFNKVEYELRRIRNDNVLASITATRNITTYITIFSFLVALLCAAYIVRSFSRRINTMVNLAGDISRGNFDVNIKDNNNDELGDLSKTLNKMAKTLTISFNQLNKKNRELDQFAYVVSHDLKAPLRGIDNIMNWIQEDAGHKIPEEVQKYHQLIRVRIRRMENMIEGLLAFSRINFAENDKEKVNVNELITEIIDLINLPPGFDIHFPENLPVCYASRLQLQQVFSNLITNSVKHHGGNKGNIYIRYRIIDNFYEFEVEDDGPGIEKDYHEKIFVIFQTLKERDAYESTGVGLAIVKKIVEENGGTITVQSEFGKGANFIFTWPLIT